MLKKVFFIVTIVFTFVLTSCNYKSNPAESQIPYTRVDFIKGTLSNWNQGDNWNIGLLQTSNTTTYPNFLSVSGIDKNGNFELTNLREPPSVSLNNPAYYIFSSNSIITGNTVICSDSSALVSYAKLLLKQKSDTTNNIHGVVYRTNYSEKPWKITDSLQKAGNFLTEFIYATKDVSLTGSVKVDYDDIFLKRETITTFNYNLFYKKGWNIKVNYIVSYNYRTLGDKTIIESEVNITNREAAGGRWDYLIL